MSFIIKYSPIYIFKLYQRDGIHLSLSMFASITGNYCAYVFVGPHLRSWIVIHLWYTQSFKNPHKEKTTPKWGNQECHLMSLKWEITHQNSCQTTVILFLASVYCCPILLKRKGFRVLCSKGVLHGDVTIWIYSHSLFFVAHKDAWQLSLRDWFHTTLSVAFHVVLEGSQVTNILCLLTNSNKWKWFSLIINKFFKVWSSFHEPSIWKTLGGNY